jgi:hypothetical protein
LNPPVKRRRALIASIALAAAVPAAVLPAGAAEPASSNFQFVAMGDQPYGQELRVGPAYRHLIGLVNAERPPFTIHVGDFKSGIAACSDAEYAAQQAHFNLFETALVYTPGDNDWTDCQRQHDDPIERLAALRARFFANTHSLGARPLVLERQSDLMPAHAAFRENQRWWHQGVLFTTLHTVGPKDNIDEPSPALRQERAARLAANIAWVRAAFALARQRGAQALVFATQADVLGDSTWPWSLPKVRRPFRDLIQHTLLPLAGASGLPVLFVHGDSHQFITDQPFADEHGRRIGKLWRLEVPGDSRMHAVVVTVQPAADPPFAFRLLWNPQSPDPH